jgi:hypothetical protein
MGGTPEEWKGCGQRRRSGFQSYKAIRRFEGPEENKVKFAKLLFYHMKGSTRIRRPLTVATIFNVPYHATKEFSSKLKTDGEEDR